MLVYYNSSIGMQDHRSNEKHKRMKKKRRLDSDLLRDPQPQSSIASDCGVPPSSRDGAAEDEAGASNFSPNVLSALNRPPYHAPVGHADISVGMNEAALNAAVLASMSGQTILQDQGQTRTTTPSFFASSSLSQRNQLQWPLYGSRRPQFPSHFPLELSYGLPLVDQDRLALLRLNALQRNSSFVERHRPFGIASNISYYQSPAMASSLILQDPALGSNRARLSSTLGATLRSSETSASPIRASLSRTGSLVRGDNASWTQHVPLAGTCGPVALSSTRGTASPKEILLQLPEKFVGPTLHHSRRDCVPLSADEDQNWLSEFLCFVRSDLVEVFRANKDDVRSRNSSKKVFLGQVGLRCRHCAHLPVTVRANRSSSYPSSLDRIYQSLTMMLRDHFGKCDAIPKNLKNRFLGLKSKMSQGATDSKQYWVYSAKKLGLVDSESGISLSETSSETDEGDQVPFGATSEEQSGPGGFPSPPVLLVSPGDKVLVGDFLYTLMAHAQVVHLEETERTGNRKGLPADLPGIACRHCCQSNRKGLCRLFPARRRTLPSKVNDLYEHIRRCTLCPVDFKDRLTMLKQIKTTPIGEKEFYDRVWVRMGHSGKSE